MKSSSNPPDFLDHGARILTESKNVAYLRYSNQIRDYGLWTQAQGYQFHLWTRTTTIFSAELENVISSGLIYLRFFP